MFQIDIRKLAAEQAKWADETFGSHRDPRPTLQHLQREVIEVMDSPYDAEEYADCFLLVMDAARRAGFDIEYLLQAATAKYIVNTNRTWATPDADGVMEHVK